MAGPMSGKKNGARPPHGFERVPEFRIARVIECISGLIEQQDGCVGQIGSGKGKALVKSCRQAG